MNNSHQAHQNDERRLVEGLLWKLEPEAQDRFNACKASHRFMAFRGKDLIVYEVIAGKRTIAETFSCKSVSLSIVDGMESVWSSAYGEDVRVSHTPVEIAPSVFMWHAYCSEVQYLPYKGIYTARFPLIYKCQHHPKMRLENTLYIQERAMYDSENAL